MPKVFLDPVQKRVNKLTDFIIGEMKRQKIRQWEMAEELGLSQQGFSLKLKRGFRVEDLLRIFAKLKVSEKDAGELLGYEKEK